jgi:hypothetical protein
MSESGTREHVTLAELEIPATGGACRQFKVPLSNGHTLIISAQTVNFRGLNPVPNPPTHQELHEGIASLANARCFR